MKHKIQYHEDIVWEGIVMYQKQSKLRIVELWKQNYIYIYMYKKEIKQMAIWYLWIVMKHVCYEAYQDEHGC